MTKVPASACAQVTGPITGVGLHVGAGAGLTETLTVTSLKLKQAGKLGAG